MRWHWFSFRIIPKSSAYHCLWVVANLLIIDFRETSLTLISPLHPLSWILQIAQRGNKPTAPCIPAYKPRCMVFITFADFSRGRSWQYADRVPAVLSSAPLISGKRLVFLVKISGAPFPLTRLWSSWLVRGGFKRHVTSESPFYNRSIPCPSRMDITLTWFPAVKHAHRLFRISETPMCYVLLSPRFLCRSYDVNNILRSSDPNSWTQMFAWINLCLRPDLPPTILAAIV